MGDRPNIFKYATKELSQDAMICWFLACLESEDEFYKAIGVKFVEFILDKESLKADDIVLYNKPEKQYHKMDVYAVLCVENKAIPIIFEDKTDTYLHSNQMKKYCDTVNGWKNEKYLGDINIKERNGLEKLEWGKTRYIYFKTGYVPEWQKKDIEEQKKEFVDVEFVEIYIDNIIDFLEKVIKRLSKDFPDRKEVLIYDYIEHLEQKKGDNGNKGNQEKWDNIFYKIFGKYIRFESSYQGWAAKSFMYFDEGRDDRNIWYSLRCGWWKKTGYAIAFQQYRNESEIKRKKDEFIEKRNANTDEVKEICREIFTKLNKYGFEFDNYVEDNKGKEQNNFFKISIDKEKSPIKNENIEGFVCDFFKEFLKLFIDAVKEKYGDRVKITENIEWKA